MSAPQRIQLRRTKGWRNPEGAIVVARPSRWGNWYAVRQNRIVVETPDGREFRAAGPKWVVVATSRNRETGSQWGAWDTKAEATAFAVMLYEAALEATYVDLDGALNREYYLGDLRGHDLACWCGPTDTCHADVLLRLANEPKPCDGCHVRRLEDCACGGEV